LGVTQAFLKFPALTALAPKQTEPPFAVAQLVVLALHRAHHRGDEEGPG
jgi:hypothetical protein